MMKMFDEKFKLTHVWMSNIFPKNLLGCFSEKINHELVICHTYAAHQ